MSSRCQISSPALRKFEIKASGGGESTAASISTNCENL
jgi:hypothetical protein